MESDAREDHDHVFRFPIVAESSETGDPLTDMIVAFIEGFLEIGCFTNRGREVTVDGFRLNGSKKVVAVSPARRQSPSDADTGA